MINNSSSFIKIIILISNMYVLLAQNSQTIIEVKDRTTTAAKHYIKIENVNFKYLPERERGFIQVGKLCYASTIDAIYNDCMVKLRNYNKYWV